MDYTFLDVNFFQDRKIRRLQRRAGANAPLVYIALLCTIFKEGYYVRWDEDAILDIADITRYEEQYVSEAVGACIEVDLFSREMFEHFGILTSSGIQKQYNLAGQKLKRKSKVTEYSLLIPSEEKPISSEVIPISSEEMPIPSEEKPTSIVEENKREENKEDYYSSSSSPSPFVAVDPSEEEKEKQEFLSYMFFKDWAAPSKELEKFIAYNSLNGRNWEKMTSGERRSALHLWKQEPAQPPRLGEDFLALWRQVDITLGQHNASWELRMDALSDGIRWDIHGNRMVLSCSQRLAEFIERHMDTLKPYIVRFLRSGKWNDQTFTYKFIQPWYP